MKLEFDEMFKMGFTFVNLTTVIEDIEIALAASEPHLCSSRTPLLLSFSGHKSH